MAEIGPILAFVSHFCRRKIQNAYFSDRLLEQEKEIIRVKTEVDIKYEMGAVCRHVLNAGGVEKNKALFFEKPKGYSIPVAAGLLDSWRSPIPLLTSLSIVSTSSVKAFSFYSSPGHTIW